MRQYRRLAPALGVVILLACVAGLSRGASGRAIRAGPSTRRSWPVLPFTNTSGDASLDTLGPSLAREVSAMLATYPMFRMVSPSGLPPQGAQDICRRYALDGDLLKSGDKLRVRARLTDAASGETVWSESYDYESEDPIAVQKKTAERIYGVLGGFNGQMAKIEAEAAWQKPESALIVYDFGLRAATYINKLTLDNNLRGRKMVLLQRYWLTMRGGGGRAQAAWPLMRRYRTSRR